MHGTYCTSRTLYSCILIPECIRFLICYHIYLFENEHTHTHTVVGILFKINTIYVCLTEINAEKLAMSKIFAQTYENRMYEYNAQLAVGTVLACVRLRSLGRQYSRYNKSWSERPHMVLYSQVQNEYENE